MEIPTSSQEAQAKRDYSAYGRILRDSNISHGAFRLWHLLRDYMNNHSVAWPGQEKIVKEIGCKVESLPGWTAQLVAGKYLKVDRFGRNHQHRYTVLDGFGFALPKKGGRKEASHPPFRAVAPPILDARTPQKGGRSKDHDPRPITKEEGERSFAPTLAATKAEAVRLGLPEEEAEKFHDHYESNGWMVGQQPMRSWEAALRKWKKLVPIYETRGSNERRIIKPVTGSNPVNNF